ncbi:pyruvate, phosphate dikinase [Aminipila sp.]|jgi:pyruvate,orthophosphate dikinase|uniref:pyruvate, phosphate dikinase n=1 Tax=Aminipila sp. TaxID=2060095 RepID=UPI001DFEA7D8|nr:pyruvate, phosphate dikinase [Aminipila sp.]MBE6034036.1 pyruvate, phosphate dikinase [Clostridiales bacterium]
MGKFVYSFNEGSKDMRNLLGGKGANLAEMTQIGLPVPFGFTVTTEACNRYYKEECMIAKDIIEQIFDKLSELENVTGKIFGDASNPLLVSVRSGSVFSMPGMMDTILNLGLNDEIVKGLAKITENERFAYDSYRRFIQMFGDIVLEIPKSKFEEIMNVKKQERSCRYDVELTIEELKHTISLYKELIKNEMGREFTQDPREQLMEAVMAVFRSWNNERAVLYRQLNNISADLGTAVNVQAMVFGNMGENSGTGVAFTRDPIIGENGIFGEFLINAQGEDVVSGIRTPQPISEMAEAFPDVYKEFLRIAQLLENHFTDMQNIEFTVEKSKLFLLQSRNAKRTAEAAVKIAVDMEQEGLIDKKTAVTRLEPTQISQLLHPMFQAEDLKKAHKLAKGLPASPGAVTGKIMFNARDAEAASTNGEKVILVRMETSPEDLAGMVAAEGILTARGGMTSHAAVVARGMGRCCVVGCSELDIDKEQKTLAIGDTVLSEGQYISLDGSSGIVYKGHIKTVVPELSGAFSIIMKWADEIRTLKVRTNADNSHEAKLAMDFGAEGIGLCRTEQMFLEEGRILTVRKMILTNNEDKKREALLQLLPFQKKEFKALYEVMEDRPVTIRLLDLSFHEFLPSKTRDIKQLAEQMNVSYPELLKRIEELREINPMLGYRGCRLAVAYPDIAAMQTEAIILAAIELKKEKNLDISPEIMVPMIGMAKEFNFIKKIVVDTIDRCFKKENVTLNYSIGTMIEVPRAALTADEIAKEAEFFSFGTNDLTQMTFGLSRSESLKIIKEYRNRLIFEDNPFETIDINGVGKLVNIAAELGRAVRPNIKLGVCGEQGGDPRTVEFCHNAGLNYVSCSPYKVPVARLAAAQAAVKTQSK